MFWTVTWILPACDLGAVSWPWLRNSFGTFSDSWSFGWKPAPALTLDYPYGFFCSSASAGFCSSLLCFSPGEKKSLWIPILLLGSDWTLTRLVTYVLIIVSCLSFVVAKFSPLHSIHWPCSSWRAAVRRAVNKHLLLNYSDLSAWILCPTFWASDKSCLQALHSAELALVKVYNHLFDSTEWLL